MKYLNIAAAALAALATISPACAQVYHGQDLPQVTIYAPPPPYYAPPPDPVVGFFGALLGLPLAIVGGALQPQPQYVPDGQGGFVPFTNSRVMPDGSLRSYDPSIDGPFYPAPQPYQSPAYTPPQSYVNPAPQQHRAPRHIEHSEPCYGPDGQFIQPPSPECRP